MQTPGVKKALTSTNEKLRRSSRAKTQVTRFAYNDYMAHHYALVMKVVIDQEPKSPSLRHRLEGENKPRRATHKEAARKAAKSRAQRSRTMPRRKPQVDLNACLIIDKITDPCYSIRKTTISLIERSVRKHSYSNTFAFTSGRIAHSIIRFLL